MFLDSGDILSTWFLASISLCFFQIDDTFAENNKGNLTMLTATQIQSAVNKSSSYYLWDQSGQRGTGRLGVKVLPSGKKQFVFRYYQQRKERFISLGLFRSRTNGMTLVEAREKMQEFSALLMQGKDPKKHIEQLAIEEKKIEDEHNEKGTLKELFHSYTERMKIDGKRTYKAVLVSLEKEFYPYISSDTKACDVTTNQIKFVISKIIQRGGETVSNRVRSYIMAAFNHGMKFDNDPRYFSLHSTFDIKFNPVNPIPRQKNAERVGERFLDWDELKRFLIDLNSDYGSFNMGKDFRNLAQLCIYLGGQRPYEIITLSWSNVNWKERFIIIERGLSKNNREHSVPLNELAYQVLLNQHELSGDGKYMFPNPYDATRHALTCSFGRSITRYREEKQMAHFSPRDLRRTCKTLMGACRIDKQTRDRLQNHALQDVSSKHYDRYDYFDEKLEALIIWNDKLKELIDYKPPSLALVPSLSLGKVTLTLAK